MTRKSDDVHDAIHDAGRAMLLQNDTHTRTSAMKSRRSVQKLRQKRIHSLSGTAQMKRRRAEVVDACGDTHSIPWIHLHEVMSGAGRD
jgi:hypothetical protein